MTTQLTGQVWFTDARCMQGCPLSLHDALPIFSARPIRDLVKPTDRVCIAFTDLTRATPNERIIPWLLEHLEGALPRENITLLNQLGTHRPNTSAEFEKMLTPAVVEIGRAHV